MRKMILNALHAVVHFIVYLLMIPVIALLKGLVAVFTHLLVNAQRLENPTPAPTPAAASGPTA